MTTRASMRWRQFLNGLIGAAVNSAATSITVVIADPQHFADVHNLWPVVGLSALVGAALYLKTHEWPSIEEVEVTRTVTTGTGTGTKTVEETTKTTLVSGTGDGGPLSQEGINTP